MTLTTEKITALAPDQASLKAANALMKPGKWPSLTRGDNLVWGECQGSGANPYRCVFDEADHGYKCTCPSRKFPCKHVLALMWMYAEDPGAFAQGNVPEWVTDWLGRRRAPAAAAKHAKPGAQTGSGDTKSMAAAQRAEPKAAPDPKAEARKKAAAEKLARDTHAALEGAVQDLEQWLGDQVRTGFATFLNEATDRCRTIAARMADGKAQALASRLDELPSVLMNTRSDVRLDALIQELGRIVLICRAWTAQPHDPELRRLVASTENREQVLATAKAPRQKAEWEVIGERISTRRDGLVSQASWLMNLGEGQQFALLLDFFPASLGKRSSSFMVGERLVAEAIYYPARVPLRAVLDRAADDVPPRTWPVSTTPPLQAYAEAIKRAPWISPVPLLLPDGRLFAAGDTLWWQSTDDTCRLPVSNTPPDHIAGIPMNGAVGLWDGLSLSLLAGQSEGGGIAFDE